MYKVLKVIGIGLLASCVAFLQACEEEEARTTVVITEEVLFISSEEVIVSGRIFELASSADDHGFQIDESENFTSPLEISLGTKSKLGKFVGEVSGLAHHTQYYYRAYVKEGDEMYFGDTKPVETGTPAFNSISPSIGYAGNIITVTGSNIPNGVKVLVGGKQADIYDLSLGSTLRFKVPQPDPGTDYLKEVEFVMGTETVTLSQPFEYVTGKWTKLDDFIEPVKLSNGVSFIIGNQFYIGLGVQSNQISQRIWKLNTDTWSWTELNFAYSGYYAGFSSALGYFGAGTFNWETASMSQRMWRTVGDTFVPVNTLPYGLYMPVSANVNGTLYVGGGQFNRFTENYNLYKYNSSLDTWEVDATIPFVTNSTYAVFSYNNLIYFLVKDGYLWTYNTVEKVWARLDRSPIDIRSNSICTVIGNKAYYGVGYENLTLVEYDIEANTWKEKYRFPGDKAFSNVAFFSYNNKIYTFRVSPFSQPLTEIWEFDPIAF